MSDPSLEVQAAVVARLKSPGVLPQSVGGRIYDAVPAAALFPYVTLGEMQVLPDKADCIDGAELSIQIDVWSRSVGMPEVKGIAAAIVSALDDYPLQAEGFDVVLIEHSATNYLRDPDGLTRHAAITLRALVQPL